MEFASSYLTHLIAGLVMAWPLLGSMALGIALAGLIVGRRESWGIFDSLYWAFITATTVGYGDFRPLYRWSKALAILIALKGMIFTGIMVALAIHSAEISFRQVNQGMDINTALEAIHKP